MLMYIYMSGLSGVMYCNIIHESSISWSSTNWILGETTPVTYQAHVTYPNHLEIAYYKLKLFTIWNVE